MVFSVMNSVLWRPLPYPDADRLVIVQARARGVEDAGVAPGELVDLRAGSRQLDSLQSIVGVDAHVEADGEHERVAAASATDGLLPLLGAEPPALGRLPNAREDVGERVRGVVISNELWRRRFGGDPAAVGRQARINNLDVQIVGVLQPGFRVFLPSETLAAERIDVWFPRPLEETRNWRGYPLVGRLRPGASLPAAQAELDGLAARFVAEHEAAYPDGDLRFSVRPLREDLTQEVRPALFALGGAVGFVLLIACVNVANLLLAHGKGRERELAVRRALGAGRGRLIAQLLAESLLLAAAGSAAGLALGIAGVGLVDWLRPAHLPRQSQIGVDGTVVLFTVALSAATALVFGLLPALRLTTGKARLSPLAGRAETAAPSMRRLQRSLIVGQVALSIVPLVGAGLMLRTFHNLVNAPIGFDPASVLTARVPISFSAHPDTETRWAFYEREILPEIRALPGVVDASAGGPLPFSPSRVTRRYGRGDEEGSALPLATQQSVLPGYLRVMGIPLREGRDFTIEDLEAQRPVAIVDERIARELWPDGAVGERLVVQAGPESVQTLEVVGVTAPVRTTGVRDDGTPHFFVPHHLFAIELALVIKTDAGVAALAPAIKRIVEPRSHRAAFDVRPMDDYVAGSIGDARFMLLVLLGFAAASLLLTIAGVHGTLAYLTAQRTRELGVRLALGAPARLVLRMVVGEAAALAAAGAVIGLAGAAAAAGALRGML